MFDPRNISPNFVAAPQIEVSDLAQIGQLGFKTIICNRPDEEVAGQPSAADVASAAAALGMDFVHIPISGPPPSAAIAAMAEALEAHEGKVLAYCRSGTRSTTLWALALAGRPDLAEGKSVDDLISAARLGGYELAGLAPMMNDLRPAQ